MKRPALLLLLLSQLVLLLLLWQIWGPKPDPPPAVLLPPQQTERAALEEELQGQSWAGREIPEIVFQGPDGEVTTDDFRGQPLVLEFISTTCPYCQRMAPRFAAALPGSGAEMLTVSVGRESLEDVRRWHEDFLPRPMPGDYALDKSGKAVSLFALRGTPTTLFVEPSGKIRNIIEGEFSEDELRGQLRAIAG